MAAHAGSLCGMFEAGPIKINEENPQSQTRRTHCKIAAGLLLSAEKKKNQTPDRRMAELDIDVGYRITTTVVAEHGREIL